MPSVHTGWLWLPALAPMSIPDTLSQSPCPRGAKKLASHRPPCIRALETRVLQDYLAIFQGRNEIKELGRDLGPAYLSMTQNLNLRLLIGRRVFALCLERNRGE